MSIIDQNNVVLECNAGAGISVNIKKVKVVTNNIRKGFEDKVESLNKLEYTELADIILLQEVNGWKEQEEGYKEVVGGYEGYFNLSKKPKPCGQSHLMLTKEEKKAHKKCLSPTPKNGVAIFVRKGFSQAFKVKVAYNDGKGRILILVLKNGSDHLSFVNVYAPSNSTNERLKFFRELSNILQNHVNKKSTIIMGGDVNSVWRWKDTSNREATNLDFSIRNFCELNRLTDAYVNKGNGGYTWTSSSSKTRKRLDSFYLKYGDMDKVESCKIIEQNIVNSDHKAVQIVVTLKKAVIERILERKRTITVKEKTKKIGKEEWKTYRREMAEKLEALEDKIRQDLERCKRTKDKKYLDAAVEEMNKVMLSSLEVAYKDAVDTEETIKIKNKEEKEKDSEMVERARNYVNDRPRTEEGEKKNREKGKGESEKKEVKMTNLRRRKLNNRKTQRLISALHNIETTHKIVKKDNRKLPDKLKTRLERLKHFDVNPESWSEWNEETRGKLDEELGKLTKKIKGEIRKEKRRFKNKKWLRYKEGMKEWGWGNKPEFFDRALKKLGNKPGIKRVPDHILENMEEGTDPTDPEAGKRMVRDHWKELYKSNKDLERNINQGHTTPWYEFTNPERNADFREASKALTEKIGENEFRETIQALKSNVAGGVDDILNEHIKRSTILFKELVREVINTVLETNITPSGWKHNRIFMIHKKKDTNDPNNYRGITLCPSLHKLLTKIVAKRLTTMTERYSIISKAQGVTKFGQSAPNHYRALGDTLEDAHQFSQEAHITYVDLKKAYDYVEFWAVKEVLTNLNFDLKFINLVEELNSGMTGDAITPLGITGKFNIERGLRQGCPLSPILFCIFIEPLIRWMESDKGLGYRFKNNQELIVAILAYMDDIALISKSHEEMTIMCSMLERYLNHYGMIIGDKSAYTNNRVGDAGDSPTIQGYTITRLKRNEAYKYLGYMTTTTLNWSENIAETKRKVNSTLNIIKAGGYDPRLKLKCIRLVSEKVAEYAFHSTHYSKKELNILSIATKKAAKAIMRTSVRTPSVSVWNTLENGGLQIAEMGALYSKTLATDLLNTLNYTNTGNINYRTTTQRLKDYMQKHKHEHLNQKEYKDVKEYWIARALQAAKDCELKIENTHGPYPRVNVVVNNTSIENYIRVTKPTPHITNIFNKLLFAHPNRGLEQIIEKGQLISYGLIMDRWRVPNFYIPHWEQIRQVLCEGQDTNINTITTNFLNNYSETSPFQRDLRIRRERTSGNIHTYTDGSEKEGEAGCGTWNEENEELTGSFRTFGAQKIYPAEMQATLKAINRTPADTTHHIYIDNNSVLCLCKKVSRWTTKDWRKAKNVREARMLFTALRVAVTERNARFVWHKVKSHTGIRGNEEADRLANEGRERMDTYINHKDTHEFAPDYEVTSERVEGKIDNQYRTYITNIQKERMEREAKEKAEENHTRNIVSNTKQDRHYSNWYLKYPQTTIAHTVNAFKARQDMLPHAEGAMERKLKGYTDSKCILCGDEVEDTAHIFDRCPAHKGTKNKLKETIYSMLLRHTTNMSRKEMEATIPCWFHTTTVKADCFTPENRKELLDFNKTAGILGIIPPSLKNMIKELLAMHGKKNYKKKGRVEAVADAIVKRIHMHFIQNITTVWKERNAMWSRKVQEIRDKGKEEEEGRAEQEEIREENTNRQVNRDNSNHTSPKRKKRRQERGDVQIHQQITNNPSTNQEKGSPVQASIQTSTREVQKRKDRKDTNKAAKRARKETQTESTTQESNNNKRKELTRDIVQQRNQKRLRQTNNPEKPHSEINPPNEPNTGNLTIAPSTTKQNNTQHYQPP